MKKLKKVFLSLLVIGLLVGCTSADDEKRGNSNDVSNKTEQKEDVKNNCKYFDFGEEKLRVHSGSYFMLAPKNIGFRIDQGGYIAFDSITRDKKNIGFQLSTSKLMNSNKGKYNDLAKISQEDSKMSIDRDIDLSHIEDGYFKMNYNFDFTETTIDGREVLLDKGEATEKEFGDKLNYAMFDFFIDKEGYFPCEVIVTSSDGVDVDELEAIARELISTIQEEKK